MLTSCYKSATTFLSVCKAGEGFKAVTSAFPKEIGKAKPTSLAFSRSLITFPDSQYNTSIPTEILIKFHHADQRLLTRGPLD